jgi:hypothetical protein
VVSEPRKLLPEWQSKKKPRLIAEAIVSVMCASQRTEVNLKRI